MILVVALVTAVGYKNSRILERKVNFLSLLHFLTLLPEKLKVVGSKNKSRPEKVDFLCDICLTAFCLACLTAFCLACLTACCLCLTACCLACLTACCLFLLDCGLSSGEACYRNAEWRARYVVDADLVEELDRVWVTTVLAADTAHEVCSGLTA